MLKKDRLFAPISQVGGDGGGGGGTALTMESVTAEIEKRVGSGISKALEAFGKEKLGSAIQEQLSPISTALASITEQMSKMSTGGGQPSNGNQPGNGAGPGNSQVPPEWNVKFKELENQTKAMTQQMETLKKEKAEADKRAETSERHSGIRTSLSNLHFVNEAAANTAFNIVEPFIIKSENGSLIGGINGDNLPADAFVKDYLAREHAYLLRPSGQQGSGAPTYGGNGSNRMISKAQLEDIKVGMTPAQRESAMASIGAALNGMQ